MILVTLGTSSPPFFRLLSEIERISEMIDESIVIQRGNTEYVHPKFEIFDFIPEKEFLKLVHVADVVVTHGGFGILSTLIKMKKKIVAVPREERFGESTNPQIELVHYLEQQKALIGVYDITRLFEAISLAKLFEPEYTFEKQSIAYLVNQAINIFRSKKNLSYSKSKKS